MAERIAADHEPKNPPGRPKKSAQDASARIDQKLKELKLEARRRKELLSLVATAFCRGATKAEIKAELVGRFELTYARLLEGENFWDLLREAAAHKMFTHTPCDDFELVQRLQADYPWLHGRVVVSQTPANDALAQDAADKLLDMIRTVRHQKQCKEVHVGFAGGMTLRAVAEKLAQRLNHHDRGDPETLVFHSMVASFRDDDFFADPNSFITYFMTRSRRVKVRLVRLPLPGLIESTQHQDVKELSWVKRVFERRSEIHIIVTSGSLWDDNCSTLRTYLSAATEEAQRTVDAGAAPDAGADVGLGEFEEQGVVGDLLWQPINREGPVRIRGNYEITRLMDLAELPAFIQGGGSVLLVMGCSGISLRPKSQLLKTILDLHPTHQWVTDVVTDSPTVEGMYFPDFRNLAWQPGRRRAKAK